MNERLRSVMVARYKAVIEDAKYKIKCYSDQEIIIPEHPDITLEIDKLLNYVKCRRKVGSNRVTLWQQ